MFIIYIVLCILIFPCVLIVRRTDENKQLFEKNDTAAIRGVSALFVMIAHYSIWFNQNSEIPINRIVMIPLEQLGGIGVLLFFFVSGYGINESYGNKPNMKGYLIKRFYGVYFPYVLMKLITNTMLLVFNGFSSVYDSVLSYLIILLLPDWFILVIILQYLSYYVSRRFFGRHDLVFAILADVCMTTVFILLNKPIGWFNALWLFTFGILVSKYQEWLLIQIQKFYYRYLIGSLVGFLFFGLLFATNKGQVWANICKPIAGFLLCISLCCVFRKITIKNKITHWFGKCSMYLYIIHIAVWDIILCHINNPILVFCGSVILSVLITEGIYLLVSKIVTITRNASKKTTMFGNLS